MRRAYQVEAVRRAEAELMARLPEGTLMQRAATGLATVAAGILRESGGVYGARVLLLVGVGDNGGDALYAGALLARRGVRVDAVLMDPARAHGGGLAALLGAGGRIGDVSAVSAFADLIVDGLLGIGGKGGLRGVAAELAEAAASCGAPILAVDLPSGIDVDTGQVAGTAIRAHVTVTFGAYKPGLLIDPAAELAGVVEFVDIGLSALPPQPAVEALQAADVAELLPRAAHETDKYGRGVVGIECGSKRYPGAARLAVGGALRSGVGAVRYSGPVDVGETFPEVLLGRGRVQAWVVGCGLDRDDTARNRLEQILALADVPVLVDADALALLAELGADALSDRTAPTVLTPHAGEAAQLLGVERAEVEAQRLDSVRRLADTFGATVLLKGSTTLVAEPGGSTVRANPTGTPALATAGSGDVLAGLIGGLLAAGLRPFDAASAGAYLHGTAARLAQRGGPIAAGDLLAAVPLAWHNVQQ
jgi:hydroxyethylthiazole kinase-like uncharacterized protein yjeF